MKKLAIIALILLQGCSTLGRVETLAACQAADAATTVVALGKGGVEANPIMSKIISNFGYGGMILFKIGLVYLAWRALENAKATPDPKDDENIRTTIAVGSAVTCAVAVKNGFVIKELSSRP